VHAAAFVSTRRLPAYKMVVAVLRGQQTLLAPAITSWSPSATSSIPVWLYPRFDEHEVIVQGMCG